jgi:hypothetical protein
VSSLPWSGVLVAPYFDNYARLEDWHFVPGLVDGRPAVLVRNPCDPTGKLAYFILLQWEGAGREHPRRRGAVRSGSRLQRNNKHAEAAEYWRRYLTNDTQSEWAARARRSLKFCEMQMHLSAVSVQP